MIQSRQANKWGALAVLAIAGLASAPAAHADIKIGALLSVTGPASFLGDPEDKTLKMYVEKINAAGGVLGQKLQLVIYDDTGDANTARTLANRLIENDKVVAVIGGSTTGTTMAAAPLFNEEKIPFISLGGAVAIIEPVQPFLFKTPQTDRQACERIFQDMKARGISKIGMISGTDGFGASMRKECLGTVAKYGITVGADESYGPTDTDMTPQLTNIRNGAGLQAVLNCGFGQTPAIVTRNYRQLAIALPLYQSHGVASKGFIQLAGAAADGVKLPASALLIPERLPDSDPQKAVTLAYKTEYEAQWKQPVSTFGGYAYDGLLILVAAIKKAGGTDGDKLRAAIEATDGLVGTTGTFKMSKTDHMGLEPTSFRMLEIKSGDWELLK